MLEKNIEATILQHLLEFADQLKRGGDILLSELVGITSQQWVILLQLAGDPNLPDFRQKKNDEPALASDLAKYANVSRANVTNLLNALAEKGLIIQVEDKEDRRRKLLYLSEKGMQLVESLEPRRKSANRRLFSNFTPEEKELFSNFLERCLRHLVTTFPGG